MSIFVLLGLLLGLLAVGFVLYPLVRPGHARTRADDPIRELEERRFALYRQILDIELDQRMGKIDRADAEQLSASLLTQATALLGQQSMAVEAIDRQIEREIQAARQALALREGELRPVQS
jgi:hypothetical protein